MSHIEQALKDGGLGDGASFSERIMTSCNKKFSRSETTEKEVSNQMKVSQEAGVDLKAESLEGTGDIKEFSGISKTEFSNLLN